GANYAVVSAGTGTLTGIKYVHTVRKVQRHITDVATNVQTVEDATLVSLVNSNSIADKLVSYYKCTQTINAEIVADDEKVGHVVSIYHPYLRKMVDACIMSKDTNVSAVTKANCELLVSFEPQGLQTSIYDTVQIITQ